MKNWVKGLLVIGITVGFLGSQVVLAADQLRTRSQTRTQTKQQLRTKDCSGSQYKYQKQNQTKSQSGSTTRNTYQSGR